MNRNVCYCLAAMSSLLLSLAAPAHAVDSVQVMALFKNSAMIKIDGKQRMLRLGKASPEGVTLISANSREAVLDIDGKRDTYILGRQISASYVRSSGPVVRIVRDNLGMFTTPGSINEQKVDFLIDTGATLVAMNSTDAKRLGIDYLRIGKKKYVGTALGVELAYGVRLNKVRVGEIELTNIKAVVFPGGFPDEVLLGNAFLSQLEMKHDGHTMELRKKF